MSNAAKYFNILAINLSILYNYFDSSTIIFRLVYLVKFLDITTNCVLIAPVRLRCTFTRPGLEMHEIFTSLTLLDA